MPQYDASKLRGHLEELGIGVSTSQRIVNLVEEYQSFTGTSPEFVFVENPINIGGLVEFSNLILLTGKMYAEFSLSNPNDTVAFINIPKNVNRLIMPILQELPFTNITAKSRVTAQIYNGTQDIGYFVASGDNCADLLEMLKRYFIPAISD
jgi:hypothetical protein